jgi:hypothetical protein
MKTASPTSFKVLSVRNKDPDLSFHGFANVIVLDGIPTVTVGNGRGGYFERDFDMLLGASLDDFMGVELESNGGEIVITLIGCSSYRSQRTVGFVEANGVITALP